ncbi:hypothetical protein [Aestuariivirga sp.]|uniref:hypothetical protein n=1 Tax=Aestuariivirga sp. TaxID=2650926 RepID=UPI0039E35B70
MAGVAAYKQVLAEVIAKRPSGTRQRLATALSKNRSFISQIGNPLYPTPIPAAHLDTIFEVCHFSPGERKQFLSAYAAAHPSRLEAVQPEHPARAIALPDLGDDLRNAKLHTLVTTLVRDIARLMEETPPKRKRP